MINPEAMQTLICRVREQFLEGDKKPHVHPCLLFPKFCFVSLRSVLYIAVPVVFLDFAHMT